MATAPAYAATPLIGAAVISNSSADTNFQTPSHATSVATAGSSGTKITEVDLLPVGTISSGGVVFNLYLYNGSTYYLLDSVLVPAVTPATQQNVTKIPLYYDNLVLPNGWSLYATETVVTQAVQVSAFGASL